VFKTIEEGLAAYKEALRNHKHRPRNPRNPLQDEALQFGAEKRLEADRRYFLEVYLETNQHIAPFNPEDEICSDTRAHGLTLDVSAQF